MTGDILAFIGFLIYLEIIELTFGNFDYYLRKNILKREEEEQKSLTHSEILTKSEEGNQVENTQ